MKQILLTFFVFVTIVSLVSISFSIQQATREQQRLTTDLQYRTTLFADSLQEKIERYMIANNKEQLESTIIKFVEDKRIAGITLYDNKDNIVASAAGIPKNIMQVDTIVTNAMDEDKVSADFVSYNKKKMYIFALPLHQDSNVIGSLVLMQNASFIDDRIIEMWKTNLIRLSIQASLLSLALLLILRFVIFVPVRDLVESIKYFRINQNADPRLRRLPDNFMLRPLIREISHIGQSLFEARFIASEEARLRLEKIDSPWTEQRLHEYVKKILKDRNIIVVSNREPYIHTKKGNSISYFVPASGMVTAIEPMIQACGGTWVAHGSGSADKQTVDKDDKIRVPPDEPKYTLKRVWLSEEEEKRYYYGFANEGLWPLCHIAHTRPVFREEDWHTYKAVNGKFAQIILKEIKNVEKPLILIQDYLFAALPRMIKNARPDAQIGIFWHIPWPNPEAFGICPFRTEILDGILGADLIGFHTQLHCNNFIETVGRELEALIDWEQFSVTRKAHTSFVKPFPISIAFSDDHSEKEITKKETLKRCGLRDTKYFGIGVDRLDYTKGILEKLWAVERFLSQKSYYKGQFTFIQIAPPSRSQISAYHNLEEQVEKEVDRINNRFKTNGWQPIIFLKKHHTHQEINRFYRLANICLVTSLHDGMNLVAKEFIASREDEKGVLILSKFAGASHELKDAILINPYDISELADVIDRALQMSLIEQKNRMKKMRRVVEMNNIYRWSAELLKTLVNLG